MMSLLKRALGLLERASSMHPPSSIGELSLAHMCICCMAIPTPHIISIIWPSLAYDCPHRCEPFTPFCLPPPPSFYFRLKVSTFLLTLIHCMSSQYIEREWISLTCTWLVVWGRVQIRIQRRLSVKL